MEGSRVFERAKGFGPSTTILERLLFRDLRQDHADKFIAWLIFVPISSTA